MDTNMFDKNTNYKDLYRKILDNIDTGVYFVDRDRHITFWNKAAAVITGFEREDIVGNCCYDNILNHIDECGCHWCIEGCPLQNTIIDGKDREHIVYLHHKQGHRVKVRVKAIPIYDGDEIIGAAETFTQIEEGQNIKKADITDNYTPEELKHLALYDQLTGLPNRRYLNSFLKSKLMESEMLDLKFGILFIDIDDFSKFNNNYGHNFGDEVLQVVSNTLINAIRKNDVVGRWGGEEFICILPMVFHDELSKIAEKIRILVEKSIIRKDNDEYHVTISIGGTIMSSSDKTIEEVIERADQKMYESKRNGKNRVTV